MEKYFLSKDGIQTKRIVGLPGRDHIDIAHDALAKRGISPAEGDGVYQQMFRLGYARVAETEDDVQIECPRKLTTRQQAFTETNRRAGKRIVINDVGFIASKGPGEPTQ